MVTRRVAVMMFFAGVFFLLIHTTLLFSRCLAGSVYSLVSVDFSRKRKSLRKIDL
jgi:hypothetical protein